MIKETITYTDYNGNERTEDFYFHLTKAEVMKMELSVNGGFAEMVKRIVAAQDAPSIMKVFEDMIQKSYGVKTADGRGFTKKPEDLEAFMATEAYSQLYVKLATDTEAGSRFVNGILPQNVNDNKSSIPAPANN